MQSPAPTGRTRLPVGAEVAPDARVRFRVWAPGHERVVLILEDEAGKSIREHPLARSDDGYHAGSVSGVLPGTRYRYRLGNDAHRHPDPTSRFQPEGPHGPSQVVDPTTYSWRDAGWQGVPLEQAVLYEMHIGTFTTEGTWSAAERELAPLADLGITVLAVMPVADFPGRFGWGYDGVNMFAPTRLYGAPDDMRRFIDRAHELGMAVILDVVYNHLGPDGNHLGAFSSAYFSTRYTTEWGPAFNFDGDGSDPVRELILANAAYWIGEFHLDGLRLDATQSIFDASTPHILAELAWNVRAAAPHRTTLLIAENEPQDARLIRDPEQGGHGLDALWNDDFHHTAMVALTGRDEAYYSDYGGTPQELVSAARHGFLYQGQRYRWQRQRRGTPTFGVPSRRFVHYLQNHDQIANSAEGRRVHELTSPARYRALTALLLLAPQTPLLFQGQEFLASAPFLYFADHRPELAEQVREGRRKFLGQFPSIALPEVASRLPIPDDRATFERSRIDHTERDRHPMAVALHRDLLRLRRDEPLLPPDSEHGIDGAVLGEHAFVLRAVDRGGRDRLLVVNLGPSLDLPRVPEPLLAPPEGRRWRTVWSSEDLRYGGLGAPPPESGDGSWRLTAEAAVLLHAEHDAPATT